ncbi:transcription factor bHLH67-like [Durio zibethinus]|uniref:Transcription factor bHLH67-like n=1 Tax=Durio zibethinus TaxID=66656 RepID=A0A6P6AY19_DURZI|nr:transcription factor bHLH67-like [Durio zibethinus]
MERLQGPINPCLLGEDLEVECLEQGFVNSESLRFGEKEEEEEEDAHFSIPSLEDKMPFLQMLQSVESPQLFAFKEPNFQTLLRLQHSKKTLEINNNPFVLEMETQIQAIEFESCVTHEVLDLHSPVISETKDFKRNANSSSCFEVVSSESNQDPPKSATADNCSREGNSGSSPQKNFTKSPSITRERRKRKRTKPAKNKEEVESQRMTHIAVERNRRRQMNDYLNSLRSLMPPSYIQRGDQASIIGGAIDFVKELEQLLQSQEAQKKMRRIEESNNSVSKSAMEISQPESGIGSEDGNCGEEVHAESKSGAAEIDVNVIHNHVNLKIQCSRRPGQLLQAIVTLESLRLTVLHLNITSTQASVLYSFNLKMEDDCHLRSADEIEAAVHQIFS